MKKYNSLILVQVLIIITCNVFTGCNKEEEPNQPPSCVIEAPSANQEFVQGDPVTISVTATDADGTIAEVRFFVDNIGIGNATVFPYKHVWGTSGASPGQHVISAKSFDNSGASSTDEVTVTIIDIATVTPDAAFSADPTTIFPGDEVVFNDESSNNPTSWLWDFGDGNTSSEQNPTHAFNNIGTYTIKLTATNKYGSDSETKTNFITVSERVTITDPRDDQTYDALLIGDQIWFAENLNYNSQNSVIYDNNQANGETYGRLYPIADATSACPAGWHLPSDDEWIVLEMFLGMSWEDAHETAYRGTNEGKKLKSTGLWKDGGNGTDEVNFAALPGGNYWQNSLFQGIGASGYWWTSTKVEGGDAFYARGLSYSKDQIWRGYDKNMHYSIRCIRD